MPRIRIALLTLLLVALAVAPLAAVAQEATPASEADAALLNAAADQLFGADTLLLSLEFQLFLGEAGEESDAHALLDLSVTGEIAIDIGAEMASADLTIADLTFGHDGEREDFDAILSGDTLYLNTDGEWYGVSLSGALGGVGAGLSGGDQPSLAGPALDLGPHGALWRLPDERGLIQLQSTLNLLTLAADPNLGALVSAVLPADVAEQAGMTGEEIAALLPLLAFIVQEPRVETTYRIDPGSGQLRAVVADIGGSINPAALGAEGEPITINIRLEMDISHNLSVTIDEVPAEATIVNIEELFSSPTP